MMCYSCSCFNGQVWYRGGGIDAVEQEKEAASLAGTWQQFSLMTRGRREPRDVDQVPTRSVCNVCISNKSKSIYGLRPSFW